MSRKHARPLLLALIVAALPIGACAEMNGGDAAEDPALELDVGCDQTAVLADMAAQDPAPACPNQPFTVVSDEDLIVSLARRMDGTPAEVEAPPEGVRANVYGDIYFHPYNGAHGGWIEAWRLCNQGGRQYVICTGGYAPVRYWKPSVCGGSVHDYYPQGWHGWAQTAGGC